MPTSMEITLESTIDLDSLFTFNYNFDRLKAVIDILLKNQKASDQKFQDIHEMMEIKDTKINNLEQEVQGLSNKIRKMNNSGTKFKKEKNDMIDEGNEEEEEIDDGNSGFEENSENKEHITKNNLKIKKKVESLKDVRRLSLNEKKDNEEVVAKNSLSSKEIGNNKIERRFPIEFELKDQKENIKSLIDRVLLLEYQIKNSVVLTQDMNEVKKKLESHDDTIRFDHQSIGIVVDRLNSHDSEIEELKNRISESNATETLYKNFTSEGGDSLDNKRFELIIGLIKNLENKVNQLATQNKKMEEEINNNIINVKNDLDKTNMKNDSNREKIEIISKNTEEMKTQQSLHEEIINNITDQLSKIKNEGDEKIEALNNAIKNLENLSTKENIPTLNGDMNESEMKILKDHQKKISDLEKNYKILISTINLDPIYKEISKINEHLATKLGQHDLSELRNNNSQLILQMNYIKDLIGQLQDDKNSTLLELTRLKRKIDNLNSNLSLMSKNNNEAEASSNVSYKVIQSDNKYVDVATFIDFKNSISKEIDSIEFTLSDIKRLIEEILLQLKAKINDTDLKNLEEYLLTKIEELKTGYTRKFADKLETSKNFKYLDTQIKHITDVYIKRMEKGDNWLLAKKPLEGFACASCESYIGDLKENNAYVPWNKYPMRDPNDKLYRMGNGFSKMLQLINTENSPKNFQTSAEFYVKSQEQIEIDQKKKNKLPKLKLKVKKIPGNMSADDIEEVDDIEVREEIEISQEPKIMKIYKKVKV